MYPNIDNVRGFAAVASVLNMRETKLPSTECILEGLKICFYHNNFIFAGVNLLQTDRTATGAPNLCSYGDIAVASIDNAVLDQKEKCFDDLVYFERYKDNCFLLWKGTAGKLESFYNFLNSLNPDLKSTMEVSVKSNCFLDLKTSIVIGQLETTVYSKPTDFHLYIHGKSCHKPSRIRGIQKGVALRSRRICSTDN